MKTGVYIENMTFRFPHQKSPFFQSLSLHFPAGKLSFIQGKNGSGKSTFFRIVQGNLLPEEQLTGTVHLNSESFFIEHNKVPTAFINQIKTVVQDIDSMLADQFSVEQNLQGALFPAYPGIRQLPKLEEFPALLSTFGIDKTAKISTLSGGQRQILAITMALQKRTSVLLLDEPTAALDPENAHMIMDFLSKLAESQHLTVLIISHDKELIKTYSCGSSSELYKTEAGTQDIRRVQEKEST